MRHLVLSLFPGADLFGEAFEREGFCVVRGPELILGQDIRTWSAIEGKFDVVIGGPPCPFFSTATRGNIPLEDNLIPEFERVVSEAKPRVFVMENVPQAPIPHVEGYAIKDFILNAHHYGANQNRKRRFSFGYRHDGSLNSWPFHLEDSLSAHTLQGRVHVRPHWQRRGDEYRTGRCPCREERTESNGDDEMKHKDKQEVEKMSEEYVKNLEDGMKCGDCAHFRQPSWISDKSLGICQEEMYGPCEASDVNEDACRSFKKKEAER